MKILLIAPPFNLFKDLVNNFFPIGLAYLAANIKQLGHEVKIFEADSFSQIASLDFADEYRRNDLYKAAINDLTQPAWQQIRHLLAQFRPELVGITSMTPHIASALNVATLCKEYNPDLPVVLGGPHPTVSPEQCIAQPAIDYVVRGEGEIAFRELVQAIDAHGQGMSHIQGLSYKHDGQIIHNPDSKFIQDLENLPFPAREDLMNPQNYTSEDMGVILTSRGCPFHCTYCYHPWRGNVHFRSIDNVIEEIKLVKKDYGTIQFAIKDDTFTVNRKHVTEFCEKMIRENLNINWDCTTRVDCIDNELLTLMIRAGCNVVKVGVETGSQKILKEIEKGITFDQIRQAARLFNKHNIFWSAYFMMGLPQETEEDILQTYKFLREINPFYASLGVYEPFRHTKLFDLGVEMGLLYPEVAVEHFYQVRHKDYYFVDPRIRSKAISGERFRELELFMGNAFHRHNIKCYNLVRRGFARRKAYVGDMGLLWKDCKKALRWVSRR